MDVTSAEAAIYAASLGGTLLAPWLIVWSISLIVDFYVELVGR